MTEPRAPSARVTFEFDRAKLRRLKSLLDAAKRAGVESIQFEGHEILVAYGGYLVEYLESAFKGREETNT